MTGAENHELALRVVSFNIRNGLALDGRHSWPLRRRSTAAVLAGLDADVVGLQEVYRFQLTWLLGELAGLEAVGQGRGMARRPGEHAPILVRRERLRVDGSWTRWFGDRPDEPGSRLPGAGAPRIATAATLYDTESGKRFVAVNTHLDERSRERRKTSVRQLAGWLETVDHPVVLTGDLNAALGAPELAALELQGLRHAVPADAGGTSHDFTGTADGARLDHVMVSEQWDVTAAWVDRETPRGRLPSDHWPVVVDLRLAD
jgi:endonuclease/exonuclease/phosphatase family metal-dependent hydrolase